MKKLFLFTLFTFLLASLGIAQTATVSGYVTSNNEPAAEETVYIFTLPQVILGGDTLAETLTDEAGYYEVVLEYDSAYTYAISSTACPNFIQDFYGDFQTSFEIDINCDEPQYDNENLFIGGYPTNPEGDQWLFISTVIGQADSYNWIIDGANYNSPGVIHLFDEPGYYTITLSVLMTSGNTLEEEMSIFVNDGMNCEALFFPYVDSTNSDQLVFVNASIGENLTYLWDFGDGNTSTEAFPDYTYEDENPDYEVCLTITGEDCDDTFCFDLGELNIGGLIGGIVAGRDHKEAKDGDGFEFVVIPPPGDPLSTESLDYDVDLKLYPNPTNGTALVSFYSEKSEFAQLRLMDMTGKLVSQKSVNINSGENQLYLDFSQLSEGVYIMFFENATNQRGVTKVVIQ